MKAIFKIVHTDHKPASYENGRFFDWYILYSRRRWGGWKYQASGYREEVMAKMFVLTEPPEFFDAKGEAI